MITERLELRLRFTLGYVYITSKIRTKIGTVADFATPHKRLLLLCDSRG